jgi:NADPH:quinone reductase-like Zn-dependent oxidoreductase
VKAVVYTKYGSVKELQLKEVDKPAPKENEVLIKIYASSVNSWDWDLLKGKPFLVRLIGGLFKPRCKILGADIAGTVESIGKNVKDFQPGDKVFGDIAGSGFGGFAEYVCVPEKLLAKKSSAMTFEQAAALPQAGLLALQGLRYKGTIKKGDDILINGAGGGVGTLALQYAKSLGAAVTCVDKAEKFEMLRLLGADHLIDYTKEDYTRTDRQYDRILDVIAHRSVSDYKRALKPGGTFAMIGGSMGGLLLKLMLLSTVISFFTGKKLGLMGYKPSRKDIDELTSLFEEGKVVPIIDRCYPLQEVPAALQYLGDEHVKGKIIIAVHDSKAT